MNDKEKIDNTLRIIKGLEEEIEKRRLDFLKTKFRHYFVESQK